MRGQRRQDPTAKQTIIPFRMWVGSSAGPYDAPCPSESTERTVLPYTHSSLYGRAPQTATAARFHSQFGTAETGVVAGNSSLFPAADFIAFLAQARRYAVFACHAAALFHADETDIRCGHALFPAVRKYAPPQADRADSIRIVCLFCPMYCGSMLLPPFRLCGRLTFFRSQLFVYRHSIPFSSCLLQFI